jgi:hypothetical protein
MMQDVMIVQQIHMDALAAMQVAMVCLVASVGLIRF